MKAGPRRWTEETAISTDAATWHALSPADTLARLTTRDTGLTDTEARARLERVGPNALRAAKPRSAWAILVAQLRSVVLFLLVVAAAVSVATADIPEAIAIAGVLVINVSIGFVTELRARRAMDALMRLEVPRATAVRDGVAREIDARQLVPGDVVELEEGQGVPADARLLSAVELRTNEAALTGESLPSSKQANVLPARDTPLAERVNMVYKSTAVLTGHARAVVVATGSATEVGQIGEMMHGVREERAPVERHLDELGHQLIWIALAVAALVASIALVQGAGLGTVVQTAIALAIAAVPEGLPAVATITMAIGVRRMARRRAVVRRLSAVETLGSATVICTDKTGTLTTSEMTATVVRVAEHEYALTKGIGGAKRQPLIEALQIAALANRADVGTDHDPKQTHGDPTDVALLVAARAAGIDRDELRLAWPEIAEVPFSSDRKFMATFHRVRARNGELRALVKGAPRRILALSGRVLRATGESPLDDDGRRTLTEENNRLAARGLRVLALARGAVGSADESALRDLTFVGLVGLIDPPAPGVADTIRRFREAGIRTVMLTGDQRLTATAIAKQLGLLDAGEEVVDGRELQGLSDDALAARVRRVAVLSRVSPADKLRIVGAYQRQGEIVAMLGDGVNDAPALKKADIGVAMGRRGTDVAKEAASVVLQDDRFETIGAAIEEGRVVLGNIQKFVWYLFSCNLAEVLVLLVASVAGAPLPLLPLQILWLNLVTDTFPALALAFEPAEADLMRRPPRAPDAPILSRHMLGSIAVYATLITASTLAAFAWGLTQGEGTGQAVTLSFLTLGIAQTLHLGNARSAAAVTTRKAVLRNPFALGAIVLTLGLLLATVYVEPLSALLGTRAPDARDWSVVVALAALPAAIGQTWKLLMRRTRMTAGRGA
jgi:Ca2+-transporting ATPase